MKTPGGFYLLDGVNTITIQYSRPDDDLPLLRAFGQTAGGIIKEQTSGARWHVIESGIFLTGQEYRALINFLKNGAPAYFYKPFVIPDTMDTIDFPLGVSIQAPAKTAFSWNGAVCYWLTIEMASVELV